MTSSSSEALLSPGFWSRCRWSLWLWLVLSAWSSDVHAANSLSVLDSKLSRLYQTYQPPYDVYEPGFAADPAGYQTRNAFQPHVHSAGKTAKDSFKANPGNYPVDGGYHTRTIPVYKNHDYPHDAGYATQNAFQPHYSKYPADDGYHTRTTGFSMYQDYQHPYKAEPSGYATRNAFDPYRSGGQQTKDGPTAASGRYLTDDGYHTRTVVSTWLPLYQDYQHQHDPGGYATQNAFQPYRSLDGSHDVDYETTTSNDKFIDDSNYKLLDEGRLVYRPFYSDDDDDSGGDGGLTGDRSTQRPTPAAATHDSSHIFVHKPSIVST